MWVAANRAACWIALALASAVTGPSTATPAPGPSAPVVSVAQLHLEPHWREGEHLEYVLARTTAITGESTAIAYTELRIDVVTATAEGYRLALAFGETRPREPATIRHAISRKLVSLLDGQRLDLRVDSLANVLELVNWQEVRDVVRGRLGAITPELVRGGIDTAQARVLVASMQDNFSSEESLREFGTKDADLLFDPLGRSYEGSIPIEEEGWQPSPFGGEPIPTLSRLTLARLDTTLGQAVVIIRGTFDSDATAQSLNGSIDEMSSKTAITGRRFSKVRFEDVAECTIDIATGWATSATRIRSASADGRDTVETVSLRRK